MFDIGFFELLIIGIVALLVIGPDQLPQTLRTLALWWGRLKRGLSNTRAELEEHLGADEIRRQLHNEDIMRQLRETRQDVESHLDTRKPDKASGTSSSSASNSSSSSSTGSNGSEAHSAADQRRSASQGGDDKPGSGTEQKS